MADRLIVRRNFWKGTAISFAAYAGALVFGFWIDFRITLFLLLALQVTWTLVCVARALTLLAVMVVLTQLV